MNARRAGPTHVLTKRREPVEGICLLAENGRDCHRKVASRGICGPHLAHLRLVGRLAEFALPRQPRRRYVVERKPHPEPGICRVLEDGAPCTAAAAQRGLCRRHYANIWQRSDLDIEDFCLPPLTERVDVKSDIAPGTCRLRVGDEDCLDPATSRGLCRRHYKWLSGKPELFERFALPNRKAVRYSRRTRVREGRCRAAENGVGCSEAASRRGLCTHHYDVLHKHAALLAKIALPARTMERARFARAEDAEEAGGRCVVLENDERCTEQPFRRGVCGRHHTILGNHADYSLNDFYTAAPVIELALKTPEDQADGLCRVLEDGVACDVVPHARGLCRRHYRRVTGEGRLEDFALAPRHHHGTRHGAVNTIPHGYLDKNVLFDHADHAVFGGAGQSGSVALVERARRGEFRASVSIDAVKTTYNHVRHRLQRPDEEGGRAATEEEAEAAAHDYVRSTFFEGSAFRFVVLTAQVMAEIVRHDDSPLSLEDALEWRAYEQAREGAAAPTWFVTRDLDFPEGIHPTHVARELGWC